MTIIETAAAGSTSAAPETTGPKPPGWVFAELGATDGAWCADESGMAHSVLQGGDLALVSVRVPGALALCRDGFAACASAAYARVDALLRDLPTPHPVRLWNFIPRILAPLGDEPHRYMAFNAGRFEAYLRWFGRSSRFGRTIPTASGVGHAGEDLSVHCLAASRPGEPVENPLQVSAYHYSRRYGTLPPSFARATRLIRGEAGEPLLLVGGTASIRGEDSTHGGDLAAQLEHTLENLAALVAAGLGTVSQPPQVDLRQLARFRNLRVYYVHERDLLFVREVIAETFSGVGVIEYVQADLCREELLVEVEGVARLAPAA